MPTEPLTGSRYPASSAAPNIPQDIQNAVTDLADNTIPRFATTTARDAAYSAWVAAGGVMTEGLHCYVTSVGDQVYLGGAWVQATGLRAHVMQSASFAANSTEDRVTGTSNWTGTLVAGRKYAIREAHGLFSTDTDGNTVEVRLRGARGASPTSASTVLGDAYRTVASAARPQSWTMAGTFAVTTTGTHFLSLFLRRFGGSGTVTLGPGASGIFEYAIYDIGAYEAGVPLIP